MKKLITTAILVLLAGCTGTVYTLRNPPKVDPTDKDNPYGRVNGIIAYQPKPLILAFETNQIQDKNGKVVGSSSDKTCIPVLSYEITSIPDYANPNIIGYDAGWFESKKFSVKLDKGVVTEVNNESTSATKETLDAFQGIVGTAKTAIMAFGESPSYGEKKKVPVPGCNAGKKIVGRINIDQLHEIDPTVHILGN